MERSVDMCSCRRPYVSCCILEGLQLKLWDCGESAINTSCRFVVRHFTCHLHEVIPFQGLISIGSLHSAWARFVTEWKLFLFQTEKHHNRKEFLAMSTVIKTMMLIILSNEEYRNCSNKLQVSWNGCLNLQKLWLTWMVLKDSICTAQ
jgi:hypothetical protein